MMVSVDVLFIQSEHTANKMSLIRTDTLWYIHIMEYYSALKRSEPTERFQRGILEGQQDRFLGSTELMKKVINDMDRQTERQQPWWRLQGELSSSTRDRQHGPASETRNQSPHGKREFVSEDGKVLQHKPQTA